MMATWSARTRCSIFVAVWAFTGCGIGLSVERPAHAQDTAPPGATSKESALAIEELRGLVAELDIQVERQWSLLGMMQASLTRAQASRELHGLVSDLEVQVERQRNQLDRTVASESRARILLNSLDGGAESRQLRGSHTLGKNKDQNLCDQAIAESKSWKWDDDRATPQASARLIEDGYKVEIAPTKDLPQSLTFTLTHVGEKLFSWEGHEHTVFARAGDNFYYAAFSPYGPGCAIVAFDLKAGKLLWRTRLWGIPVPVSSQYLNRVNLEADDRHLVVYGNESDGRYIELLDLKTGRTMGHRNLGRPNGTR